MRPLPQSAGNSLMQRYGSRSITMLGDANLGMTYHEIGVLHQSRIRLLVKLETEYTLSK
jgi:hypothetical protein